MTDTDTSVIEEFFTDSELVMVQKLTKDMCNNIFSIIPEPMMTELKTNEQMFKDITLICGFDPDGQLFGTVAMKDITEQMRADGFKVECVYHIPGLHIH